MTRHFGEKACSSQATSKLHRKPARHWKWRRIPRFSSKDWFFPELSVTLLEPVTKKRAFLKEAARVCGFDQVAVRGDRLEELASAIPAPAFDFATMRAVGNLDVLVPLAARTLKTGRKPPPLAKPRTSLGARHYRCWVNVAGSAADSALPHHGSLARSQGGLN